MCIHLNHSLMSIGGLFLVGSAMLAISACSATPITPTPLHTAPAMEQRSMKPIATQKMLTVACRIEMAKAVDKHGICALIKRQITIAYPDFLVSDVGGIYSAELIISHLSSGKIKAQLNWSGLAGTVSGETLGIARANADITAADLIQFLDHLIAVTPAPFGWQ